MAKLFPFQGYRYSTEKIEKITDVVTQPYDKISAEMKQNYLDKNPFNIVRVIKNPDYAKASQYLNQWIQQKVLKKDIISFYHYYISLLFHLLF